MIKFVLQILWILSQLIICLWHTLHNWRQTTMDYCKIPSCCGFVFQYAIIAFLVAQIEACCLEFDKWWSPMEVLQYSTIATCLIMFSFWWKTFEFWLKMFLFVNNGYKIIKIDFSTTMASKSMRSKKWWIWKKDEDISFSKHWIMRSWLAIVGLLLAKPPCRK